MDTEKEGDVPRPRAWLRTFLVLGVPCISALVAGTLSYVTDTHGALLSYGPGWCVAVAAAAAGGFVTDSWPLIRAGAVVAAGVIGTAAYTALYDLYHLGTHYLVEGVRRLA